MLTDYEREQLALIQAHLDGDPSFTLNRQSHPVGFIVMVFLGLVGLGLLLAGVALNQPALGLGGFVVMLCGSVTGFRTARSLTP